MTKNLITRRRDRRRTVQIKVVDRQCKNCSSWTLAPHACKNCGTAR